MTFKHEPKDYYKDIPMRDGKILEKYVNLDFKGKNLNLGCGYDLLPNCINTDIIKPYTLYVDLQDFPLPFKTNEFDLILCKDVLEHLENVNDLIDDMHRICKPNGKIVITVPYYTSPSIPRDTTHKRGFSLDTLEDWDITFTRPTYFKTDKKFIITKHLVPTPIGKFIPKPLRNIIAMSIGNIINAIIYELEPIKD